MSGRTSPFFVRATGKNSHLSSTLILLRRFTALFCVLAMYTPMDCPWGLASNLVSMIVYNSSQVKDNEGNGGERGIRTPDTVSRIHAFQACAFSHSAIS